MKRKLDFYSLLGLLRWVFVVPVIANNYTSTSDPTIKEIAKSSFQTIHQFGGVMIGEHLGQLFTIIWTIMVSIASIKLKYFTNWVSWLGIISSIIYFFAQAELFSTVITGFPVWDMAGFIGSSLWLIWLIVIGVMFMKQKDNIGSNLLPVSI